MSEKILSHCGYRCDLCLAYAPNIEQHPEYPKILSVGWFHYFGFKILAEDIYCDGCRAEKEDIKLIDENCPVRSCVIAKGIDNCAVCESYSCENCCKKLAERLVSRDEREKDLGDKIPEGDYKIFIEPYENKKRLDELRKN